EHTRSRGVTGGRRRRSDPPLLVPIDKLMGADDARMSEQHARALFEVYQNSLEPSRRTLAGRFRYADAARKVVGVGSVGSRSWVVWLLGHDGDGPLLLQVKEAQPSVLEGY